MKHLLIALAFGIVGCGQGIQQGPFQGKGWPAEVDGYVRSFVTLGDQHGNPPTPQSIQALTVEFLDEAHMPTSDDGRIIGYCQGLQNGLENHVSLDQEWWAESDDFQRQALVFHELGHCLMLMVHRGKWIPAENRPSSLMYPFIVASQAYQDHYDDYNAELFVGGAGMDSQPLSATECGLTAEDVL